MRTRIAALAAAGVFFAGPALAVDIHPTVNTAVEWASDLRGLAFGADGKIVASGHVGAEADDRATVVARFNADGTPDVAFGNGGFVHVDVVPGGNEQSLGVVELANGDIVALVNAADEDGGQSIYLVRFDSSGTQLMSPDWGDDEGKVEVVFGWANTANDDYPDVESPPSDTGWDLLIDRSGSEERLVVMGLGSAPDGTGRTDNDRYITRLMASDGSVDPGFNGGTAYTFHSAGDFGDNGRRGLVEPDGSIVSAGYTNFGGEIRHHVILIRLLPDGTPDPDFGGFVDPDSTATAVGLTAQPGIAVFNPFVVDGGFAECYAVVRMADGSYVTTGYGGATATGLASTLGYEATLAPDIVSFRLAGNAVDTTWGNNGTQAIQSEGKGQPTNEDRGRQMVALPDGTTVHAGRFGGNAAVVVLTPDGQLDTTVDGDGILELGHPDINSQFFNAVVSEDGSRIALTTNNNDAGARLVILEVGE